MRLTTRGRFAVNSMIDLAIFGREGPVRLSDIAHREKISEAYLEQIFCRLRRAKLVRARRGPGGGYTLARDSRLISAGEIVAAVEGPVDATQCQGDSTCRDGVECLAHGLWAELNRQVAHFLYRQTLADIAAQTHACSRPDAPVDHPIIFR